MPLYYHYTDDAGANKIIRTGRLLASLKFVSGDTAYGNGVYFTQLNPDTSSKTEIAMNNWQDTSEDSLKKTENYFVFDIPESEIKDSGAKDRNIFVFGEKNDLQLQKYPWWLKNFDSNKIIASYKYKLMSLGPASVPYSEGMGDYTITEETVNGRPVYEKKDLEKSYLSMASNGMWLFGPVAGGYQGWISQRSCTYSLGPDMDLPWSYTDEGSGWKTDDTTLKAYAWQI